MAFTFIHTADWQLGAQFGSLPIDIAARLQAARLDAIDTIAGIALEKRASHVLVAGDVFDDVRPPQRLVGQTLARLAKHRSLVWHFLSGNHDPATPGSVWDDVARAAPGPHIRLHLKSEPAEIAPGVVLLPAPLLARAMSQDPTAYMDRVETPPGTLRIGMAHGSVQNFSSEGEAAIPIAVDRAAAARLDYLALGDWHGTVKINPRTWYSGTPEPDRFRDNSAGQVLAVTVDRSGAVPVVESIAAGAYSWRQHALDIASAAGIDGLIESISAGSARADRMLLKLAVTGRVPLSDGASLEQSLDRLAATVAYLALDRSLLALSTEAADIEALGAGAIATVAALLAEKAHAADPQQQLIANRALQLLTRFAGAAS